MLWWFLVYSDGGAGDGGGGNGGGLHWMMVNFCEEEGCSYW
jgi:hypothetical protein